MIINYGTRALDAILNGAPEIAENYLHAMKLEQLDQLGNMADELALAKVENNQQ